MARKRPYVLSVLLALGPVPACHESPPPSTVAAPGAEKEQSVAPTGPAVAPASAAPAQSGGQSGEGAPALAPPPGEQQSCSPESRQAQACTMIYAPVCAVVDTGIRCITAPCPSTKLAQFSNACTACKDKSTMGYYSGECVTSAR